MSKRILIADDEEDIRQVLRDMLKDLGYETLFVRNGEEAIKKMALWKPDLAILDISMPKAGGYDVCRHMKTQESLKNVPVIILSAFTRTREGESSDTASLYLHKPFDHDTLIQAIERLLKNPTS